MQYRAGSCRADSVGGDAEAAGSEAFFTMASTTVHILISTHVITAEKRLRDSGAMLVGWLKFGIVRIAQIP